MGEAGGTAPLVKATGWLDEIDDLGKVTDARGLTIDKVEPAFLSYTYPPEHVQRWSGGELPGVTAGLVRITTTDGLYGLGETYAGNFAPEVVRSLIGQFAPYLVGRDASDISGLWRSCYSRTLYWGRFGISISVLSALESALWDLCGKALAKPVVELLGGAAHDRLPRYASGGMEADPEQVQAEQRGHLEAGFRATKVRGGRNPGADRDLARTVRETIGPAVGLAFDAVQGSNPNPWSSEQAIEAGKLLEEFDLIWYEEPCASTDPEGYVDCRKALSMPIAGGESCTTYQEFRRFLDLDALDIGQPDAAHIGGVLETRKVAVACEHKEVPIAVHAWAAGGCLMANYHAGFASPNCEWLEYPTQPNPLISELLVEPLQVANGMVLAPTAPGLGIDITPEVEAKYPYKAGHHYLFAERRD